MTDSPQKSPYSENTVCGGDLSLGAPTEPSRHNHRHCSSNPLDCVHKHSLIIAAVLRAMPTWGDFPDSDNISNQVSKSHFTNHPSGLTEGSAQCTATDLCPCKRSSPSCLNTSVIQQINFGSESRRGKILKRGLIDLLWHYFKEAPLMLEFDPPKNRSFKIAWHRKTSFDLDDRFKSLASHLVEKKICYCVFYDDRFIYIYYRLPIFAWWNQHRDLYIQTCQQV